jgi:ATP-binding cassette subfamily C protein LapB
MGLRRRFVLIRAILNNPKVIFLDDPTEGLDQAGQLAVARLLNRLLTEGRTLVVASNETFILRAADIVVDMDKKPVPMVTRPVRSAPDKVAA